MRLKSDMYAPEQAAIRKPAIDILELDELNGTTLYGLDNNTEKQAKVMDLMPKKQKIVSFSEMADVNESSANKSFMAEYHQIYALNQLRHTSLRLRFHSSRV